MEILHSKILFLLSEVSATKSTQLFPMMKSKVLLCPQPKDILYNKREIFTFKML